MKRILFIPLLTILNSYLYDNKGDNNQEFPVDNEHIEEKSIEPGISKTFYIKYFMKTNISFNNAENEQLQINIHSINCNIKVESQGNKMNKININTYYIIIKSTNKNIIIEPLTNQINGEYIENYNKKYCYISMNSYYLKSPQQELKIQNKEENMFYLNEFNYNLSNIIYEIKNITNDSFVVMNFKFIKRKFHIDISLQIDNAQINSTSKDIYNSTNIYLNGDFLSSNKTLKDKTGKLKINITNYDNTSDYIYFKIIEKNTVCLLEKNALNFGFSTTKTVYQYYYAEVFKGEEGELMLHNKRFDGELYGKIIEKNEQNLSDISIYPTSSSNEPLLEYNKHYLKLKYSYKNTSQCFNGCYLLITYKKLPIKIDIALIGYEFTILSRTWNYSDYISQIIDIPYNEFIIGCFFKDTAQNHYYSLYIPEDAEKIILEIESNNLDLFYDEGRKRINSINPISSTKKLEIINNEGVFTLDIKNLKYISFVLRPINYYTNIFSFYYFRVLYFKEKDPIFYPIDSYLGNLCIPEYNTETNKYYCNFILENKYNESKIKFVISSTNQNEYYKINVSKVFENTIFPEEEYEFVYSHDDTNKDINLFLFTFEFNNSETKNIIAGFSDGIENITLQIYSIQMFFIDNFTKKNNFNIENNYTLIYQYINGKLGFYNFLDFIDEFPLVRNFKGRPICLPINKNFKNSTNYATGEFSYYYQLKYNNKIRGIEETKLGEPMSLIINEGQFPLYFYVKLKKKKDVNIIINLRLKANIESDLNDEIEIKGYFLNQKDIMKKVNGEYIQLKDPIEGYYSLGFDMGYLEIIREYEENNNYLLIEIEKKENPKLNSYLLIDIVPKEYNNNKYGLPINRYIFETFNNTNNTKRESNQYHININQLDKVDNTSIFIELYSQCDDVDIKFEQVLNVSTFFLSGFKKYRIYDYTNKDDFNIYFSVEKLNYIKCTNPNYMIRYFYTQYKEEYEYHFDENFDYKEISYNDNYVNLSLTFNGLTIITGDYHERPPKKTGIYFLITGILYKQDEPLDICVNTTEIKERQGKYFTNSLRHNYTKNEKGNFTLKFENIPRNNNYVYNLQLQVNAIPDEGMLNEEYLIFNTTVDLTFIKFNNDWVYILTGIIGGILLIIALFFLIKYLRLRKRSDDIQKEIKSIEFSNEVQKNVLIKEKQISKKEKDYETTFI